ncbi:MAG: hypothetical protein WDM78_02145 [Puia sp.]
MDWEKNATVSSKRKFTWSEIAAHEQKIFDIPIMKDSLPVPGVYLTFEEFKSNSPSVTEFEITKDKLNDFIHIKTGRRQAGSIIGCMGILRQQSSNFCQIKIQLFKLQRRQNAFYIYGSNQTVHELYTRYYPDIRESPALHPFRAVAPQSMTI